MKNLRRRFERFCLKNRGKGISNLMLVIAIGNLAVYVLSLIDPSNLVYGYLYFSRTLIMKGQIWRLFTYVFTYLNDVSGRYLLLAVVSLFCYYQFGKILESYWGTFRFNLYYLVGIVLTDAAAMLFGFGADATALNLSLFLAVATIAPESRVLLLFIIPIKMKYMAWVYLGFTVFNVAVYLWGTPFWSFFWLSPIVPLLTYFLFFGSDVKNILPNTRRPRRQKNYRTTAAGARPNANWASGYQTRSGEKPYRHKCAVCGRTDTQYPNLEFRYCSKCSGYYCYCIDHINNHVHITDSHENRT